MSSPLDIPELSLVVLVGISGSGKSTFARQHFAATEVLSSDICRALVSDDENDQDATKDAFDVLHYIAGKRLARGLLTVVDATNVQADARKKLVELGREYDVLPTAIVLDLPEALCVERTAARADRDFDAPRVLGRQHRQLRRGLRHLRREGFRQIHVLSTPEDVEAAEIVRTRLYNDRRDEHGPFDVIGDVHGCRAELEQLLTKLGYQLDATPTHPDGRRVIFLGDLVDRGPDNVGVLRLAMDMVAVGSAIAVPGNHEARLQRALRKPGVKLTHGLQETMDELAAQPDAYRQEVERFIDGLISYYVLDDGRLVVAHAGLIERYHGRASGRVRAFCLYGQTTGETDEYGLPVRYPWAEEYRGNATVLYGHTPVPEPQWINNTLCIDTGCVFGGRLTALRYPERELVSVAAARTYYEPVKPLAAPGRDPGMLDIQDVLSVGGVETTLAGRVSVREDNSAAALEVMSRFAIDPRWLRYLPPTMSPVTTATDGDLLEHPEQAFSAYRSDGITDVLCEEKHMGSRAVVVLCRDESVAVQAFDDHSGVTGAIHTRTGRAFFPLEQTEELLAKLRDDVNQAGLWEELGANWLILDAELLPWSAKAEELLRRQYAAVGAAGRSMLSATSDAARQATDRGIDVGDLLDQTIRRATNIDQFVDAYRHYVWPTDGIDGIRIAPFQLLCSAGATYHDRPHAWHLALADRLAEIDPALLASTRRIAVDTADPASVEAGVDWWTRLTAAGGEGMVVKPAIGLAQGRRGTAQPGLKVRGREYLRLIYGPDYTDHLDALRQRAVNHKRSLALREYALGVEGLDRAARDEPLWRIHQCVFAVLALESEPIDPRL